MDIPYNMTLALVLLLPILVLAAHQDYRHHKISNSLSMSGWLIGPVAAFLLAGMAGLTNSLLGLLLMLVLFLPLWLLCWFGAGDVKLLATVGAFVGLGNVLPVILGVTVTGLLMAIGLPIYHGKLMLYLRQWLVFPLSRKLPTITTDNDPLSAENKIKLPYAIPIAFGTIVSILYLHL